MSLHRELHEVIERRLRHWAPAMRRRLQERLLPAVVDLPLDNRCSPAFVDLALRRGWFDDGGGAARWDLFCNLVSELGGDPRTATNCFNLAAQAPEPTADFRLDDQNRKSLEGPLMSRQQLGAIVEHLSQISARAAAASRRVVVHHGRVQHPRGTPLADLAWHDHQLRLVHAVDPFGPQPWEGASAIGKNNDARLVAVCRPLGLMIELEPDQFVGEVIRGEPDVLHHDEHNLDALPLTRHAVAVNHLTALLSRSGVVVFVAS